MKIVIDIPESIYATIMDDQMLSREQEAVLHHHIYFDGTPLPKGHGRLIDAKELRYRMYHEAFETDTDLQKWDSGCWIRYKMFERIEETAPTIIEADKEDNE